MLRTGVLLDGLGIGANRGPHRIVAADVEGRGEIVLEDPFPRTGPVPAVGAPAAPVGRP